MRAFYRRPHLPATRVTRSAHAPTPVQPRATTAALQEHFPDRYDQTEDGLHLIFRRVAAQMRMNPDDIDLALLASGKQMINHEIVPFFSGKTSGAAGPYHHAPAKRSHISAEQSLLKDPMALVAVLAHELGDVLLLRPGPVERGDPDMEPLTDLLTAYLGFGIFTANSAFHSSLP